MHIINQISSTRESHVIVKSDGHEDWGNLILPQSRTANTFEQYYNLSYPSIFSLIAHNPCAYYMLNSVPLVLYNLIGCHNNPPAPQEPCCTNKETIFKRWVSGQHSLLCGSMRFKPRSDLLTSGTTRKNGKPWQTRGADDSRLVDLLDVVTTCWLLSTIFKTSPGPKELSPESEPGLC